MVVYMSVTAQNTATVDGNWDVCATWNTPAIGITKGNDAASAKTINTNTTVTMNTNWNALSVDFVSGTGILDFNGTTNALDLNLAGGMATTCVFIQPAGLTLNFCGITQTQSPAGAMTNNVAYTGTVTVPYTKTGATASPYPAETIVVSGLTLARTAGTFAAATSGTITYNLTGTYTGVTGGTVIFPLAIFTNNAQITYTKDRLRNSIYSTAAKTNLAAYDAAATNAWIPVTQTEYNAFAEAPATSNCGVNTNDIAGSNFATGNFVQPNNTYTFSDYGPYNVNGNPIANYTLYAIGWNNAGNNPAGTGVNPLYYGSAVTSGYLSTNGPLLTAATSSGFYSWFVRKKSTLNIGNRIYIAGYNTATLHLDCYTSAPGNPGGFGQRPYAAGNNPPNTSNACQGLLQLKLSGNPQW
jgi:hypothetical protein